MAHWLHLYWFATKPAEGDAVPESWFACLSPHERMRAARYVRPAHGVRYAIAHARLREILARRLDCRPEEIAYTRAEHGKPGLAGELARRSLDRGGETLHFNLSHSGDYALVGLSDTELGIDIEGERPRLDGLALANRYFTPAETSWLSALAPGQRVRGFSRLWTCKEAMLKADGRGLALPLRSFEVGLEAGGAATLKDLANPRRRWWVREFDLVPGYAAAVVQPEPPATISIERL